MVFATRSAPSSPVVLIPADLPLGPAASLGLSMGVCLLPYSRYPLAMTNIAINITIFYGYIAIFHSYVCLPEGICHFFEGRSMKIMMDQW